MRGESAAEASGPTQEGREILVPGGHGTALVALAGQLVEIVDARTADREDVGLLMATGGKAPTEVTKDMAAELEEAS